MGEQVAGVKCVGRKRFLFFLFRGCGPCTCIVALGVISEIDTGVEQMRYVCRRAISAWEWSMNDVRIM